MRKKSFLSKYIISRNIICRIFVTKATEEFNSLLFIVALCMYCNIVKV